MKVEIFNLCDYAAADASAKLNLIGIFDTIYARETPVVNGFCTLAARVRFDRIEEGLKKFKISFVDSDGRLILPSLETQILVQIPPESQNATAQIVTQLSQLILPRFGEYSIDLAIDGRQEASTPIYARQIPFLPPHLQTPPSSEA